MPRNDFIQIKNQSRSSSSKSNKLSNLPLATPQDSQVFLTIFLHFLNVTFSLIVYQHMVKYVPFQMKHPTEKTCYSELSPITFNHITYKHHEFQMWESKSTASICTCRV